MDAVIELARRLGKAIANAPQSAALRKAREELNAQPEVSKLLAAFRDQSVKIATLEADQKPVEVDDKRKLQELQDKLVAANVFKKYTAAQVEYVDLMRKVNDALQKELGETEKG